MTQTFIVQFSAGPSGPWKIVKSNCLQGEPLPAAERLSVSGKEPILSCAWTLYGAVGNLRYTDRAETITLAAKQEGLGRSRATRAALIPIRKTSAWWALAQDERRKIFEEQSRHITIGIDYLPAIARRLHHCREIGEPFDFLTWFEFAPEHEVQFDEMLIRLRATEEWSYVDREIDIRLSREAGAEA